jgi:hypothetical protein
MTQIKQKTDQFFAQLQNLRIQCDSRLAYAQGCLDGVTRLLAILENLAQEKGTVDIISLQRAAAKMRAEIAPRLNIFKKHARVLKKADQLLATDTAIATLQTLAQHAQEQDPRS